MGRNGEEIVRAFSVHCARPFKPDKEYREVANECRSDALN